MGGSLETWINRSTRWLEKKQEWRNLRHASRTKFDYIADKLILVLGIATIILICICLYFLYLHSHDPNNLTKIRLKENSKVEILENNAKLKRNTRKNQRYPNY